MIETESKFFQEIESLYEKHHITFSKNNIAKLHEYVFSLTNWDKIRINPIAIAHDFGIGENEIVLYFILGAKAGLFTFEWSLLCPICGGREHSHLSLNQLNKNRYHCTLCDVDVNVSADESLEVSFSLTGEEDKLRKDIYNSMEKYWAYYFSKNIYWPEPLQKAFSELPPLRYFKLDPGTKISIPLDQTELGFHRIISLDMHSIFNASLGKTPGSEKMQVDVSETGFSATSSVITFEKGNMEIFNASKKIIGILALSPNPTKIQNVIKTHPPKFKKFLTGKMILNNQTFRELFLVDNLPDDLSLKINDITLLFTDLKGSTELYDQTGDVSAYSLVQKHFKILEKIVQEYNGGIVKTMGDAIMASFNRPLDGIQASLKMVDGMKNLNDSLNPTGNIALKIGLHRGNVIAVKANQTLDYFGQSVNIAARIQALAGPQEIWMSNDIKDEPDVSEYITKEFYLDTKEVRLKGVGQSTRVHCLRKD